MRPSWSSVGKMYCSSGHTGCLPEPARSSGLRSPSAFACCASREDTGKISGAEAEQALDVLADELVTSSTDASSRSKSTLLMMTTIFLPQSRMTP